MKTKVIFYKHWNNDIVAIFLDECLLFFEGRYQDCNPKWWSLNFPEASELEYSGIKKELELLDYNLRVLNKIIK